MNIKLKKIKAQNSTKKRTSHLIIAIEEFKSIIDLFQKSLNKNLDK